ncbi:hypothetical protein [Dyadobacter sp. CY326]|uniref:hypothetical protein n=1 Tax=Dyadobacter sp. CY326 TaxID=2907300 RepID=UPI001F3150CF|nr:hypothetical protein [Dyadobacter sp. CY326]MCE7063773.1 hypothetical protein [Dyadobacter sp. CY326]
MESNRELGATIILIGMILFWVVSTIRKNRQAKQKQKILLEGIEANATVLNIEPTGEYLNNLPEYQMKVKVQDDKGADFVAEVREILSYSKYDAMKQGSQVLVKYDPEYYNRVIFLQTA